MPVWEESTWEVSRVRDDISCVQRPESIYAFGKLVSLSRFRELLAIATLENPVFVLPWGRQVRFVWIRVYDVFSVVVRV